MHSDLSHANALAAIKETGLALHRMGFAGQVRIVLAGGVAGLLGGLLSDQRTTGDCDVLDLDREDAWKPLLDAAAEVAQSLRLPSTWLNRDCQQFAYCFPLGWKDRVVTVGQFGPLSVQRVSRFDLIASKVVSGPQRPQDYLDVLAMDPTHDELDQIEVHLNRLAAEHLDGFDYTPQRGILQALRNRP